MFDKFFGIADHIFINEKKFFFFLLQNILAYLKRIFFLVLQLRNVTKTFTAGGENWSFGSLFFHIAPAESVALLGRSGSGKSTFSLFSKRTLIPDSGEVLFEEYHWQRFHENNRHNIGMSTLDSFFKSFSFSRFDSSRKRYDTLLVRRIPRKKRKNRRKKCSHRWGFRLESIIFLPKFPADSISE